MAKMNNLWAWFCEREIAISRLGKVQYQQYAGGDKGAQKRLVPTQKVMNIKYYEGRETVEWFLVQMSLGHF